MSDRLLELFEAAQDTFVSGEELSGRLGISRTAVWKQIERLREQGYQFEAVPRRGYRLMAKPDKLDLAGLQLRLRTRAFGRKVFYYDSVESTQAVALQLCAEGAFEGALVLAEEQTLGRGRMGRQWHSPKGKGLWMSLVLRPNGIPLSFTPQLTLLVAVALCRAIRSVSGVSAGIKWPNDILVDGRKVAGILLESRAENESLQHVIAGVGISVNLLTADYPEELRATATSLAIEAGAPVDRIELLSRFLEEWETLQELYRSEGFAPVKLLWEALSVSLQRRISVRSGEGWVEGYAEGLDELGALLLRLDDGSQRRMFSGEVELR